MSAILNALSRGALVWLLLMAAESLQGVLRRLFLSPTLELALRQLSVMVGVAVIFAITWALLRIDAAWPSGDGPDTLDGLAATHHPRLPAF